jgi:hypothetical protein
MRFQAVTPTVGFKPVARPLPDAKLKPKIQGDCYAWTADYLFSLVVASISSNFGSEPAE